MTNEEFADMVNAQLEEFESIEQFGSCAMSLPRKFDCSVFGHNCMDSGNEESNDNMKKESFPEKFSIHEKEETEVKNLGDCIFAVDVENVDEAVSIIGKSVDKYMNEFTRLESRFLKEYLRSSFILEEKMAQEKEHSERIVLSSFIKNICDYATDFFEIFKRINNTSEIEDHKGLIDVMAAGDINIPKTVSMFLTMEYDYVKRIHISELFDYDDQSRNALLSIFCGMDKSDIYRAIVGLYGKVTSCSERIKAEKEKCIEENRLKIKSFVDTYKPADIVAYLDESIVKQDEAKMQAALFVYKHCHRLINNEEHGKRCILFYGSSGSGKSQIWRDIAKLLERASIKVKIIDVAQVTPPGYIGASINEIIARQLSEEPELSNGFIVLDEIDKLFINAPSVTTNETAYCDAVQASFLKLFDEDGQTIDERGNVQKASQVSYVCLGSFSEMDDRRKNSIGFNTIADDVQDSTLKVESFIRYGMIRELAGRIGKFVGLEKLEEKDYYQILEEKNNNPLMQLSRHYLMMDDIELCVNTAARHAIASEAFRLNLGVRGMYTIAEEAADKKFYQALKNGTKKIEITEADILKSNKAS